MLRYIILFAYLLIVFSQDSTNKVWNISGTCGNDDRRARGIRRRWERWKDIMYAPGHQMHICLGLPVSTRWEGGCSNIMNKSGALDLIWSSVLLAS
ncbi:hypothetical protein PSV08DRAFT_338447 [Bipolaris maydis]|uniref:uncharacterized protein n=1 Tax=Cochliobolus heterostrophus TaxID=5016 RepID=UPI0024CE78A2|nr:hypothetical protein J3E73DRAFT_350226 [Bipolaris maydis]KAJ6265702.1 hypothetical protein PSV08DRAFT_338447 [Bipolaris maydis]